MFLLRIGFTCTSARSMHKICMCYRSGDVMPSLSCVISPSPFSHRVGVTKHNIKITTQFITQNICKFKTSKINFLNLKL